MNLFLPNSRISIEEDGILFLEQDIIFSEYEFSESNLNIETMIDYLYPGFGFVIAEKNTKNPTDSEKLYLFKIGSNSFSVYRKEMLSQALVRETSCVFSPGLLKKNIKIVFVIENTKIKIYYLDKDNEKQDLGSFTLSKTVSEYFIGFYSSKGNIIHDVNFITGVPNDWNYNIKNTEGGRIRFFDDGFEFEKCTHSAELEQIKINLLKGTYFFKYDTKTNANGYDIKHYLYYSKNNEEKDSDLEDEYKNIPLGPDDDFTLNEDTAINIKFVGHNGIVKNIKISKESDAPYVRTQENSRSSEGSSIIINLDNVKQVKWTGIINSLPPHENLLEEPPYAIIKTAASNILPIELDILLKNEYMYIFDVENKKIKAYTPENINTAFREIDIILEDKEKAITIFKNMSSIITSITLVLDNGEEINPLIQQMQHKYVPAEIKSPIIVLNNQGKAINLSSSYREVIRKNHIIESFNSTYQEIKLKSCPANKSVKVYGIPVGVEINNNAKDITDFSSTYVLIEDTNYMLNNNIVNLLIDLDSYKYIAIEYDSSDIYDYYFTNWEREIFKQGEKIITEYKIPESIGTTFVYGCKDEKINEDYLYRVHSVSFINSIDLCSNDYDLIPEEMYKIEYETNEIMINKDIQGLYNYYIVDYVKYENYSINYDEKKDQYSVDIMLGDQSGFITYDMNPDGNISEHFMTDIIPEQKGYLLLRRKEDLFTDDHQSS